MNQYVTGCAIKTLRERNKLTQAQFAEKINVSDKAVSKWETGRGYPDITLLDSISKVFGISVTELISGNIISNTNQSANMLKCGFCVCPVCKNVIPSTGQAAISCHGIELMPLEAEQPDEMHPVEIETVEDEYYVTVNHPMEKDHYITFIAALNHDRINLVRLYPQGQSSARFKITDTRVLYWYCNRDGLFMKKL